MVRVTVLLVLMTSVNIIRACPYCCKNCGEILLESKEVFINDTVNITCQLSETYVNLENSTALFFTKDPASSTDYPIKLYGGVILNKTTFVLQHTITLDDNKKNFYCESKKAQLVDKVEFFIDYFPQEVTNFSCVYEDLEKLQCSWKHPVNYIYPERIKVTFEWRNEGKTFSTCPTVIDKIRCENITSNIHALEHDFRINVTNTHRNVTISTLIARRFPDTLRKMYAKPMKVQSFTEKEKNMSSVELMWDLGKGALIYIVRYNSTEGPKYVTTRNNSTIIVGLSTYTAYIFSVKAQYPDFSEKLQPVGLPSDTASIVVWTSQDVAKSPPRVTDGGFLVLESTESRNITVFWQNFEDMDANGPIIGYDIVFNRTDGRVDNYTVRDVEKSQFTLYNIPYRVSGHVTIKAETKIGLSEASPPIYIPSSTETVNPPDILLEIYNKNSESFTMSVSWTKPNSEKEVKGYTVYWCESTVGCQKKINWINIAANQTSYDVENLDISQNYLFGVSLETGGFSSGFKWENCFYMRDKKPTKPSPVQISGVDKSAVTVTWTRPRCDESSPFVRYYIVNWCLVDECSQGENSSVEIPTSIRSTYMSYRIENLMSGSKYVVWLTAVNTIGEDSVGSKNYNVSTTTSVTKEQLSDNMVDKNTMYIIIGVFCAAVFMLILICAYTNKRYNWCEKLNKLLFEKPEIVLLPIRYTPNNSEPPSRRNENGHVGNGVILSGHDNPLLNLTEPEQNVDELQPSTDAIAEYTPENPDDMCYIKGDNPQMGNVNGQCNQDYTKIVLYDHEDSEQTIGNDLSQSMDAISDVSCTDPLLNMFKTENKSEEINILVIGKNPKNIISENDPGLEKQHISIDEIPSKMIRSVSEHNLSKDSGQSSGNIEQPKVTVEISVEEKSVSGYMSHDKILTCNQTESTKDTNKSGNETSSSKYIHPPNLNVPIIINKTSSGIGTSLETSLCNKTESSISDDTSNVHLSIENFVEDSSAVSQRKSIKQTYMDRIGLYHSQVSSSSVLSDESTVSSVSNVTMTPIDDQPEHPDIVQTVIDYGYKTVEDLKNLDNPVQSSQRILQDRQQYPIEFPGFSDENTENDIDSFSSDFDHFRLGTNILSNLKNDNEMEHVRYLYQKKLDNERQEIDGYIKQNNVIDENFNIPVP